jgi:hypothetical protein
MKLKGIKSKILSDVLLYEVCLMSLNETLLMHIRVVECRHEHKENILRIVGAHT